MAGVTIRDLHVQQPGDASPSSTPALDKYVTVRHPGYEDKANILFILLAADSPTGALYHGLVHSAAGAIAGNRYDGYLSRKPDGPPISQPMHELLPFASASASASAQASTSSISDPLLPYPYPIVPSFSDWEFPHGNLPTAWSSLMRTPLDPLQKPYPASRSTEGARHRHGCCRMTGAVEGVEVCHILPYSEDDWFGTNDMSRYTVKKNMLINDIGNAFCLRADLHATYDTGKWVVVPKANANAVHSPSAEGAPSTAPNTAPSTTLVFHLLEVSQELASLFQNVPVRPTGGLSPEFLFAAFVRTIFPSLTPFLRNRRDRYLIGAQICPSGQTKLFSGPELAEKYRPPGYRTGSSSPKKRQKASQDVSGSQTPLDYHQAVPLGPLPSDSRKRRRPSEDCVKEEEEHCSGEPTATPRVTRHQASETIAPAIAPRVGARIQEAPCTCQGSSPTIPISPASSASAASAALPDDVLPHSQICASSNCQRLVEMRQLDDMRELALQKERAKSGKTEEWQNLLNWAVTAPRKGRMSPRSIDRWFWVQGCNVEGEDGIANSDGFDWHSGARE